MLPFLAKYEIRFSLCRLRMVVQMSKREARTIPRAGRTPTNAAKLCSTLWTASMPSGIHAMLGLLLRCAIISSLGLMQEFLLRDSKGFTMHQPKHIDD